MNIASLNPHESTYKVGSIRGIPIHVSLIWIAVFALFTVLLAQEPVIDTYIAITDSYVPYEVQPPRLLGNTHAVSTVAAFSYGLLLTASLYATVLLHELGHVYGAVRNTVKTERIELWMLGGAAHISPYRYSACVEFEIAAFGPIVTGVITCILFPITVVVSVVAPPVVVSFFHVLLVLNAGVFFLNIVPVFPLDGGRIVRSVVAMKFGYETATYALSRGIKICTVFFGVVSLVRLSFVGVLVNVVLYSVAHREQKQITTDNVGDSADADASSAVSFNGAHVAIEITPDDVTEIQVPDDLLESGAIIDRTVNNSTDYILVPDKHVDKYRTLASHYNAVIVTPDVVTNSVQNNSQ